MYFLNSHFLLRSYTCTFFVTFTWHVASSFLNWIMCILPILIHFKFCCQITFIEVQLFCKKTWFTEVSLTLKKLRLFTVYNLVSLNYCINPWNQHYNLSIPGTVSSLICRYTLTALFFCFFFFPSFRLSFHPPSFLPS